MEYKQNINIPDNPQFNPKASGSSGGQTAFDQSASFNLDSEWDAIEDFLGEGKPSTNSQTSQSFHASSHVNQGSAFSQSKEDDYFEQFSRSYNTTGPLADKYKIEADFKATPSSNQQTGSLEMNTFPSLESPNEWNNPKPSSLATASDSGVFQEILQTLQTNNQYLSELKGKMGGNQTNFGIQHSLSDEILTELKTNSLYLSRLEHKIDQLIRNIERLVRK